MVALVSQTALFSDRSIPERVPCLALDQPYAGLVVAGVKTLETRTWAWPYEPGWLAVYATRSPDLGAIRRLGLAAGLHALGADVHGAILGIVWVAGCRPMRQEDQLAAWHQCEPGLFVWPLEEPRRFAVPDSATLARGPQKFVYVHRSNIMHGLGLCDRCGDADCNSAHDWIDP